MLETSARLLRLLSLLQMPREWTGPQLAQRLSVTTRTVRNDVERLRSLGYPVDARPGAGGGYRLGAGNALPPLLLDDDEAMAVAVGLRTAAAGGVAGIEETSLRALVKLEQVLPSRLRHRLETLLAATAVLPRPGPVVEADVLAAIAGAVRAREQLRFEYESFDGAASRRTAEPHRLVHTRGRWYLAAWDVDREAWRTFRVDRVLLRTPNGPRFASREEPEGGLVEYVERSLGSAAWRYRARAIVHAPVDVISARVPAAVVVEPIDDHTCAAHVGSDTPQQLALWLGMLDADFTIDDAPELAEHLLTLAHRYSRAVRQTQ